MEFKVVLWILVLALIINNVQAASLAENTIVYTIVEDSVIVEHNIKFSEEQESWKIKIPLDSEAIELKNASFYIGTLEDQKVIFVEKAKEINLKYISDSFVEKTKDRYFTINLAAIEGKKDIKVILPESASLKYSLDSLKSSIIPYTKDISTDGKSIILHWNNEDLANSNSLLIIYNRPTNETNLWTIILIVIILLLILFSFRYFNFKKSKKVKIEDKKSSSESKEITRNLFEEEKAIVEALLKAKNNEMWQKQLLFETGISKVKMSRKLRSLEKKGLIEKVPFGNTNKIRLKK